SATCAWSGARWHTGSVAVGLPVSAKAWQRQPPKSSSRRGQLAHGSFIHAVPRKALKAGECVQISASERARTFQNSSPVIDSAAWQGSTLPAGVTLSERRPQPPTQGRCRTLDLLAGWHQRGAILQRPAIVLHVRDLDPARVDREREIDHVANP